LRWGVTAGRDGWAGRGGGQRGGWLLRSASKGVKKPIDKLSVPSDSALRRTRNLGVSTPCVDLSDVEHTLGGGLRIAVRVGECRCRCRCRCECRCGC
jgi:hypothetical protein